jgi:hypothetical protein
MVTKSWEEIWGSSPPQNIIRDLEPGSTLLKELKEAFIRARADVDILSCLERVETSPARATEDGVRRDGSPVLYVSECSSCWFHPGEEYIQINADHSRVAKLSGSEGSPYHKIKNHLARMVTNARILVGHRI